MFAAKRINKAIEFRHRILPVKTVEFLGYLKSGDV